MDETCIKVTGQWKYLYRAVDKAGNTVAQLQVGSGCKWVLARLEGMHMIREAQITLASGEGMSLAEPFDALARQRRTA